MEVYIFSENDRLAKEIKSIAGNAFAVADAGTCTSGGVIIVQNPPNKEITVGKDCVGIAEENDEAALNLFKKWGLPVVTCGYSSTATITISSDRADSAVISVRRPIITIFGQRIEEGEITVHGVKGRDRFALLAWAAATLLLGGDKIFADMFDNRPAF